MTKKIPFSEPQPKRKWPKTTNRFVAFFDILGFKDAVSRESHESVLFMLSKLNRTLKGLPKQWIPSDMFVKDQVQYVTFSDSILVFSKGNSEYDALKFVSDVHNIYYNAINSGIPIKGAIAYGKITADFKNSLFFGQPIIDAYELHNELDMMAVVLHGSAEHMLRDPSNEDIIDLFFITYSAYFKKGRFTHRLMRMMQINKMGKDLAHFYYNSSGSTRKYFDSTNAYLQFQLEKLAAAESGKS